MWRVEDIILCLPYSSFIWEPHIELPQEFEAGNVVSGKYGERSMMNTHRLRKTMSSWENQKSVPFSQLEALPEQTVKRAKRKSIGEWRYRRSGENVTDRSLAFRAKPTWTGVLFNWMNLRLHPKRDSFYGVTTGLGRKLDGSMDEACIDAKRSLGLLRYCFDLWESAGWIPFGELSPLLVWGWVGLQVKIWGIYSIQRVFPIRWYPLIRGRSPRSVVCLE